MFSGLVLSAVVFLFFRLDLTSGGPLLPIATPRTKKTTAESTKPEPPLEPRKWFIHPTPDLNLSQPVGPFFSLSPHVTADSARTLATHHTHVYSHSHNIVDGRIVYLPRTVIGQGVRITYHATVLAGTHVADDSMVGAGSMLTRSTDPHWVYVGVPARKIKEKSEEERASKAPPTPDPFAEN